ncbi:MAG TPA: HAMP domain-containing sensor histidine kinase [Bacteroidia bacterium]|nr:HAMP domain-containing sensor histidine kinase [Bacteroidia bacterium]
MIVLGLVAITGILSLQLLWTKQAFNLEEKKFSEKVQITLLHVVDRLYKINNNAFPLKNPINKISSNYYIVNVNNDFEAEMLEYCLKTEFAKSNLLTDFEYAIYQCESDEMVYGNYISMTDKSAKKSSFYFPKQKNLIYYFAIRFPNETTYFFSSLKFWLLMTGLLVLILLIYVYSIFTILQQKKYSELQRDFINNMTHEFKTPLSSILIASNYLAKQEQIRSDEKLEKYTEIIINQSDKLNKHIEKILNIARADNSPLNLDKKNLNPVQVIQGVIDNLRLKHNSLKVNIESPNDALVIEADEFHFTNLVYNILDNSIKYCEQSPEINVRLTNEERQIQIEFIDNGIGISKNKITFIFDKFYRIPNNKSSNVNGFGLGLYYVKKICGLHHWKISALNNTGNGITVSLLIPKH